MSFGANDGYVGWSMSVRAAAAYDEGEMPKSKWSKKAMLWRIVNYLDDNDLVLCEGTSLDDLLKMKKDHLFDEFFELTSWHHTSKFFNETSFYDISDFEMSKITRPITEDEIQVRRDIKLALREAKEVETKCREDNDQIIKDLDRLYYLNSPVYLAERKSNRGYWHIWYNDEEFGGIKIYHRPCNKEEFLTLEYAMKDLAWHIPYLNEREVVFLPFEELKNRFGQEKGSF